MVKEGDLNSVRALVEEIIENLVQQLSKDKSIPIEESLDIIYNSMIYRLLCDEDTNLYSEGFPYVYEILNNEIQEELSK